MFWVFLCLEELKMAIMVTSQVCLGRSGEEWGGVGRSGEEWGGVGRPPDGPAVQESERVRLYCNDVMAGTSCDPLL